MTKSLKVSRSKLMESMLYVKPGIKYSLNPEIGGEKKNMEYLRPVIDCLKPKRIIIAGRQIGKSTMMAGESVVECCMIPGFGVLYGAPDENKLRTFSNQRLWPFIDRSPVISEMFMDTPDCINNLHDKRFSNGSMIIIRNASNEDNLRAPSVDRINMDEIQAMQTDNLYVATKSMFTSPYQIISLSGTPLSMQNPIQEYFSRSTQNEWLIPCEHCKKEIKVGSTILSEHHWICIGPKNVTRNGLVCDKCGKPIDKRDGQWVWRYEDKEYEGFRIPQPLSPFVNWDTIMDELESPYIREARKMNEIFGLSWDSADRFFTESNLREVCGEHKMSFSRHDMDSAMEAYVRGRNVVAGIDWAVNTEGGAETVMMIGVVISPTLVQVIFISRLPKSLSMEDQVSVIVKKLKEFGVTFVVADWGAAGTRNVEIAKAIGRDRVCQIGYNRGTTFVEKYHEDVRLLMMNRTMCLSDLHADITSNKHIIFPRWEDFSEFSNDFLVEYVEEDRFGQLRYDHPSGTHDDALHACVYMNIARKLVLNMPILHMVINTDTEIK